MFCELFLNKSNVSFDTLKTQFLETLSGISSVRKNDRTILLFICNFKNHGARNCRLFDY